MADICPRCKSTDVQAGLSELHCLQCGASLDYTGDGSGTFTESKRDDLFLPGPSDSSVATPTATPVYEEHALTRQPVVDTNQEPIPTPNEPGPTLIPAPDLEAQGVAGELSDETPREKKTGGPKDQPRTADLTKTGKPTKDTLVDHTAEEQPPTGEPTEQEQALDLNAEPKGKKR